jgi:hypothetical protein
LAFVVTEALYLLDLFDFQLITHVGVLLVYVVVSLATYWCKVDGHVMVINIKNTASFLSIIPG